MVLYVTFKKPSHATDSELTDGSLHKCMQHFRPW